MRLSTFACPFFDLSLSIQRLLISSEVYKNALLMSSNKIFSHHFCEESTADKLRLPLIGPLRSKRDNLCTVGRRAETHRRSRLSDLLATKSK